MKIEPISVHGSYEYMDAFGMKRWKKISIGATVTEDDNPIDCILELEKKVEEAYKKISKELEIVADNVPIPITELEKEISPTEKIKEAIAGSSSIKVLETFKLLVKNNTELQTVYDNTLNNLQCKK